MIGWGFDPNETFWCLICVRLCLLHSFLRNLTNFIYIFAFETIFMKSIIIFMHSVFFYMGLDLIYCTHQRSTFAITIFIIKWPIFMWQWHFSQFGWPIFIIVTLAWLIGLAVMQNLIHFLIFYHIGLDVLVHTFRSESFLKFYTLIIVNVW